jgi:hypothetical protein
MSHAFPIATRVEDALKPGVKAARTRSDAEALAPGFRIESLATDWLNVTEAEAEAYLTSQNDEAGAHGHLQKYEDNEGKPVLAVTWWKLVDSAAVKAKPAAPRKKPATEKPPVEDHTDDLYFRSGRTKPRRKRYLDPRQMDLFKTS